MAGDPTGSIDQFVVFGVSATATELVVSSGFMPNHFSWSLAMKPSFFSAVIASLALAVSGESFARTSPNCWRG